MAFAIQIQQFGGVNYRDQSDLLMSRAMTFNGQAWTHMFGPNGAVPLESPYLRNVDFERQNIRKRKGSILDADLVALGIMLAGDSTIDHFEYVSPVTNLKMVIAVSSQTIYIRTSGTWAQAQTFASAPYTHATTVTKCTFTVVDGHCFIGLDGNNPIQCIRGGITLDPPMVLGNTYYAGFGAIPYVITGTWGTGNYLVAAFESALVFAGAQGVGVQYTASNNPGNLLGGGSFAAQGQVTALNVQSPYFTNQIANYLYVFSQIGVEYIAALGSGTNVLTGAQAILGYKCVTHCKNWVVYLTYSRNILAINGNNIIDLGRRLNARGLTTGDPAVILGPLDTINIEAPNAVYTWYDEYKQQVLFHIPTGSNTAIDTVISIDMSLGEPQVGESLSSYETHVRCLHWDGMLYVSALRSRDSGGYAMLANGQFYMLDNGNADYGTTAINGFWKTPDFPVGFLVNDKNWTIHYNRSIQSGNWNMTVGYYINRSSNASRTFLVSQVNPGSLYDTAVYDTGTYVDTATVKGSDDTELYGETLAIMFSNSNLNETFDLWTVEQRYNVVLEER